MKQFFLGYWENLKYKSYPMQILTLYWWSFLAMIPAMPIMALLNEIVGENDNGPQLENTLMVMFVVNVLVPIIETFVYQHGIYWIMQKIPFTKGKMGLYILVSSILFGLSHWYSLQYIVFATFMGFVLGVTYVFYREDKEASFWSTALIHALRNTTATIIAFYVVPSI